MGYNENLATCTYGYSKDEINQIIGDSTINTVSVSVEGNKLAVISSDTMVTRKPDKAYFGLNKPYINTYRYFGYFTVKGFSSTVDAYEPVNMAEVMGIGGRYGDGLYIMVHPDEEEKFTSTESVYLLNEGVYHKLKTNDFQCDGRVGDGSNTAIDGSNSEYIGWSVYFYNNADFNCMENTEFDLPLYYKVQTVTSDEHWLFIEIDADFDEAVYPTIAVGGVNYTTDFASAGVTVGRLKKGKNYIFYPFIDNSDYIAQGIFMDARKSDSVVATSPITITVKNIGVYDSQKVIDLPADIKVINKTTIYPFAPCVLYDESEVSDYMLMEKENKLYAFAVNQKSNTTNDVDITYFTPLDRKFESVGNSKGVYFEQYTLGQKLVLEKNCVYYISGSAGTKNCTWHKADGSRVTNAAGEDWEAFNNGTLMLVDNLYDGKHRNLLVTMNEGGLFPTVNMNMLSLESNEGTYIQVNSGRMNVWVLKL